MKFTAEILDIDTDDIVSKIMRLKPLWIPRSEDFKFYTLGRCAYLDGIKPQYKEEIKFSNPLLRKEFSDLYLTVIDYMSKHLGETVFLNNELAHPSFHILESNEYALYNGGSWHMDYPQLAVGHQIPDQTTFTLAIKLPTGGAGIDYSDDQRAIQYLDYKEKQIIVHDGLTMHRIAPLKEYVPGEFRITMQGHIIRIKGKLNMFW